MDPFNIEDTFINSFSGVLRVPQGAWVDWAAAFSKATKNLIDACELPASDPMRPRHILQAAKWYSALPQLILREPSRNPEADARIIKLRLHQFLTGNYADLIGHWFKDVRKQRARTRRSQGETSVQRVRRAVDLVLCGDIARGLRLIDSNGIAPQDDEAVQAQMKEKHPVPEVPPDWPFLPEGWTKTASEVDLANVLRRVTREADVRTGVGPRRLNVHYIQVLALGVFEDGEAQNAFDHFSKLGSLYISMGMPAWLRACLGGGLLTALNKATPVPEIMPDARPVKAEDSDTSLWCKALARITEGSVRSEVIPQQLGVGVKGGQELYVHGANIKAQKATDDGVPLVIIAVDVKNAHNSFDRVLTQKALIEKASSNPGLIPLAVAHESIACAVNPIFMRSNEAPNGFVHLCDSHMGGGQGNALTGQLFVIDLDGALKKTEAEFTGVELKAIQDDITIFAPPDVAWATLEFLRHELEGNLRLKINTSKCKCYGTTPDACAGKPDWLEEPSCLLDKAGNVLAEARGISICNCPIGEPHYVKAFLEGKIKDICSAIEKSSTALKSSSSHADYLAFYYSYQARFDYWLSTNYLVYTDRLAEKIDDFLRETLSSIAGVDIFAPPPPGTPLPFFVSERASLKSGAGGLGFRRHTQRYLLLNSLNNTLPQAIDRIDEEGTLNPGLWNSLLEVLGAGSFDATNKEHCWSFFHGSGIPLAHDHLTLIERVKERWKTCLLGAGIEANEATDPVFSALPDCFGLGVKKLHKTMQDKLRALDAQTLLIMAQQEMTGDDQRRRAFAASIDNKFANAFPNSLAPDESQRFNGFEFPVAMARKLGMPIPIILPYIGTKIKTEGGSPTVVVDPFGNGITAATGVKGGHVTEMHNAFCRALMGSAKSAGVPVKGANTFDTCNGVFGKCLHKDDLLSVSDEAKVEKQLQKIVPDGVLEAGNIAAPMPLENSNNPLFGRKTLTDAKTLASHAKTPSSRDRLLSERSSLMARTDGILSSSLGPSRTSPRMSPC